MFEDCLSAKIESLENYGVPFVSKLHFSRDLVNNALYMYINLCALINNALYKALFIKAQMLYTI